jgi:MFS family permease
MKILLILGLTILSHTAFTGSRMTVSLYAISLRATAFEVGVMMSLYALLPMLLAVAAGRLVDRVGVYRPMLASGALFSAGVLLPSLWPALPALYVAASVIGTGFMVFHVALNNVVGNLGTPDQRAANFSWLAIGYSISGLAGPLVAGFAIDGLGHRLAFFVLTLFPLAGLALLAARRRALPHVEQVTGGSGERRVADLLRNPRLIPAFVASGLLSAGWDIYTFVMPIYGTRLGLSASMIGIIMGSFAAATLCVRIAMPLVARRLKEWAVVCGAMLVSGVAYGLFPAAGSVPLLLALSFLLGIGLGSSQPMIMSLLYAASPPGRQGEVIGVRTTILNSSHTLLPLSFGALGSALGGMAPVFGIMAVLLLWGGVYARRQMR